MPSTPEAVAGYLTDRAQRVRMSSLTIAVAAIQTAHRTRGVPSPISDDIRLLMKGLRRMLAKEGRSEEKQAQPLTENDLKAIVATAKRPRQLPSGRWETDEKAEQRGALDIALACLMRDAGLRRGEAAVLQWGDITRLEDGTGRVRVRRSKTDQGGEGMTVAIGRRAAEHVEALREEQPGSKLVFGLGTRQISNRLRQAAEAAGVPNAEAVTGHSGRIGLAQRMVQKGAPMAAIMRQGRWSSTRMVGRYVANLDAGEAVQYLE